MCDFWCSVFHRVWCRIHLMYVYNWRSVIHYICDTLHLMYAHLRRSVMRYMLCEYVVWICDAALWWVCRDSLLYAHICTSKAVTDAYVQHPIDFLFSSFFDSGTKVLLFSWVSTPAPHLSSRLCLVCAYFDVIHYTCDISYGVIHTGYACHDLSHGVRDSCKWERLQGGVESYDALSL